MRLIKRRTVSGPRETLNPVNLRGSYIKTYTTQRVPTDWWQHSPKVCRCCATKSTTLHSLLGNRWQKTSKLVRKWQQCTQQCRVGIMQKVPDAHETLVLLADLLCYSVCWKQIAEMCAMSNSGKSWAKVQKSGAGVAHRANASRKTNPENT